MSRSFLIGCAMATGCFYSESINQRPSIDIIQVSGELSYRGSTVVLEAAAEDPEGHNVAFTWRAYACTNADAGLEAVGEGCDQEPFHTEAKLDETAFVVPFTRADIAGAPVEVVFVVLEGQDDYGATARPMQQLLIPVSNHAPSLELAMRTRYGYVVDTPIELYAKVGDLDDGPASTQPLTWTVYSPMNQPNHTLVELPVEDDDPTNFFQLGKTFTPEGTGEWTIEVTATDPLGAETTRTLVVNVMPDRAPCLAQWAPIAAHAPNVWPLTEASLFQVAVVDDDLDPYPTVPDDSVLDTTTFSWSILPPGGSVRQDLGVTGNQVVLDPGNYAPGDIVELRVEIADRNITPVNCADDQPTCSVISTQCIQRQTWRVEVR